MLYLLVSINAGGLFFLQLDVNARFKKTTYGIQLFTLFLNCL